QRRHARHRKPTTDLAASSAARGAERAQPEGRVLARRLRDLHDPGRRRAASLLPGAGRRCRRCGDHDGGGAGDGAGRTRTGTGGVPFRVRSSVRLLHTRDADGGARADSAGRRTGRSRTGDRSAEWTHLPLHGLREDRGRGDRRLGWGGGGGTGAARTGRSGGMKAVGARLPRYDGVAHVTGRSVFVDDVRIPGTLVAKALRSPHHSARITRLDTSKAERLRGVRAVVTQADVPLNVYGHLAALGIPADEPLLAEDEVRYRGQPIAAVAAEDADTALEAVD